MLNRFLARCLSFSLILPAATALAAALLALSAPLSAKPPGPSLPLVLAQAYQPLPEGTLRANFFGGTGILTVRNGQPVAYSFGNWNTAEVRRASADEIHVGAARIRISRIEADGFRGTWTYQGQSTQVRFRRAR